jgi:hypothetical protein
MLSVPQMLWLVNHASENVSRVLLVGDSAQHRSVERGDALRILEQSGAVRYVELLQTQRQKELGLKAARDFWNGALDAYRHMTSVEQNQTRKREAERRTFGTGITKEVVGFHGLLMHPLFGGDILRR